MVSPSPFEGNEEAGYQRRCMAIFWSRLPCLRSCKVSQKVLVGDGDRVQDEAWPELHIAERLRHAQSNSRRPRDLRIFIQALDDINIATLFLPTCRPSWLSPWCRPSTGIPPCSTGSCCPSQSSWRVSPSPACTNTQLIAPSDPHWYLATLPFDPSTVRPQAASHQSSAPTAFADARCQSSQQLPAALPLLVRCSQGIHDSGLQRRNFPCRA